MTEQAKVARIAAIGQRLAQIDYSLAGSGRAPNISTVHLDGEKAVLEAELDELQRATPA